MMRYIHMYHYFIGNLDGDKYEAGVAAAGSVEPYLVCGAGGCYYERHELIKCCITFKSP